MKKLSTIKLETKRLILRRFTLDDSYQMYNNWASDDEVTKFMTWPSHINEDVSRSVLNIWVNNYCKDDFYQWGIVIKETNELIGSISVVNISEDENAEVGYCISRKHWNKGITTEAFIRVIEFLFDEVGVKVVSARHDKLNPASGEVMKKCGLVFKKETISRNNMSSSALCNYYELKR